MFPYFYTFDDDLEIFNNIPHIPSNMVNAVPPALKNGSGIPVFGIEFVTTPILITTCTITNVVIPVARRLPNMSGAFNCTAYKT